SASLAARVHLFFPLLNATAPPEISPLSLHDALPISAVQRQHRRVGARRAVEGEAVAAPLELLRDLVGVRAGRDEAAAPDLEVARSEEHTSELQSRENLVCRLLLEKKKKTLNVTTRTR